MSLIRTIDECVKGDHSFADKVTEIELPNKQLTSLSELLYKPIIRYINQIKV